MTLNPGKLYKIIDAKPDDFPFVPGEIVLKIDNGFIQPADQLFYPQILIQGVVLCYVCEEHTIIGRSTDKKLIFLRHEKFIAIDKKSEEYFQLI